MKKQFLILLFISLFIYACRTKDYPALIDEVPTNYTDADFEKLEFLPNYLAYKSATTKNSRLPVASKVESQNYPWDIHYAEELANGILNEMESNFTVMTDGASDYNKTLSGTILFITLIPLSPAESNELKAKGSITRSEKSILDEIRATVKSCDLTNEKGEKVNITQTVLGTRGGGIETKEGKDYHIFGFETLGLNAKYLSLKGFVEIEIEIATEYEREEIDKNDVGDFVKIDGEKAKILEFDDNAFISKWLMVQLKTSIYFSKTVMYTMAQ